VRPGLVAVEIESETLLTCQINGGLPDYPRGNGEATLDSFEKLKGVNSWMGVKEYMEGRSLRFQVVAQVTLTSFDCRGWPTRAGSQREYG
jgi:hypothetical protein